MAVKMRLARHGAKKRPFYHVVVADERAPRDGRYIEKVGRYNPMVPKDHAERLVLNEERVKHWLAQGAQPTDRVARFLGNLGLAEKFTVPTNTKKSNPKAKALERIKEKENQAQKAREAAAAAAEEAKAAAEAAKQAAAAPAEAPAEAAEENAE
jgi:small subunit ribosomal protein S16